MNVNPSSPARWRRVATVSGLALIVAAALGACGSSSTSSSSTSPTAMPTAVTVSNPYVNEPSVPDKTGAFALLKNTTPSEIKLTKASVPPEMAAEAQLHETQMADGAMTMSQVTSIPIPANSELQLKSSGYHIMLMGPKVTLGQTVPITLTFSDGTTVTADAPVKAPQPMPSMSESMSESMSMSMSS